MSVQKLVAEADKFFEKGKYPDGLAKLKSAIALEPLNQIVVTKLASILIQNREPLEAAKVYGGLAKRLSDAGKNQVAIAIFKQALDLAPADIALRLRYAQECEAVGKLGDAFLQGQQVLSFYLRRKKYFDASNILPLMARAQPKDEKVKIAWVEVMQLCQAEQKLVHLLVALCGPPGLSSQEFPQGGDPVSLSAPLYEGLKRLVPYFPRDPKVAYTVAWSALRRGNRPDFFHYLREALRREPDFCLGVLLFARVLAEDKLLNESLFVYRYYKERMIADKSSDMLTLNRLMEAFVEKNGWIKFIEDSGDILDTAGFYKALTGAEQQGTPAQEAEKAEKEEAAVEARREATGSLELPPAEIEIGGLPAGTEGMEILTATGQSIADVRATKKPTRGHGDPLRIQAELIKATVEAAVAGMGSAQPHTQQTVMQPVVLPVIQAAAIQGTGSITPEAIALATAAAAKSVEAASAKGAEISISLSENTATPATDTKSKATPESDDDTSGGDDDFKGESVDFTSLIRFDANALKELKELAPPPETADATRVATVAPGGDLTMVATPGGDQTRVGALEESDKTTVAPVAADALALPAAEEAESEEEPPTAPAKKLFNPLEQASLEPESDGPSLSLENQGDERTQMFSPIELLDAVKVMQNREIADVETKKIEVNVEELRKAAEVVPPPLPEEIAEADKTKWRHLKVDGEKTIEFSPVEAVQAGVASRRPYEATFKPVETTKVSDPAPPDASVENAGADPTVVFSREDAAAVKTGKVEVDPDTPEANSSRELAAPVRTIEVSAPLPPGKAEKSKTGTAIPASPPPSEGPAFMPIPVAAESSRPGAGEDKIDLGDDLLEGPTRIFTQPTVAEKTEHFIKEIKGDLKNKVNARLNIDLLMKKAERHTAKRNYYLARKALRHAQALGADEETVKKKLREIRKLELPDGLYNTISSDQGEAKVDTADVLERLEREFELTESDGGAQLGSLVEGRIEEIFRENDARTILDFGVGLHEMGLFRQAEALFIRLVEDFPDYAFDAYYLASVSKLARRDYAGAASILKRLSSDNAKTDLEKIQIYYALGEIFEKMRQHDRSKKFFKKVAELDANYRNIRNKLEE